MDPERTRPDEQTRRFEQADAAAEAAPGDMPTPDEEAAAERAGGPSASVTESYEEMAERGARQRGEGRIP
jgi:hypothetical protein